MNRKLLGVGAAVLLVAGYLGVRNRARLASAAATGRDRAREIAGKATLRRRGDHEGEEEARTADDV